MKGDPDCKICHGQGFVYAKSLIDGGRHCDCVLDKLRLRNMELVWKGLAQTPLSFSESPLTGMVNSNVWVTAPMETFRGHLKSVALKQSTMWEAKVRTDADILDAWFGTLKVQGAKIYDTEIERTSIKALDISDLVEPPELLILMLGVKQLPNKEAPNGLLEAISYRGHLSKPTWIVDQPDHPIDQINHLCFSEQLVQILAGWERCNLTNQGAKVSFDIDPMDLVEAPRPPRPVRTPTPRKESSGSKNLLEGMQIESRKNPRKQGTWKRGNS